MRLIVGLGNPGVRYRWTRHNLGFRVLDRLSRQNRIPIDRKRFKSLVGEGLIGKEKLVLVKPQTYINRSGIAVKALVEGYKASPEDLIVCCDDVNLELGRIRIRRKGGSGGHKGLRSIIESLATDEFPRIRIGIANSIGETLTNYVLSGFRKSEKVLIKEALNCASLAVELILKEGIAVAMNRYNPKIGEDDKRNY